MLARGDGDDGVFIGADRTVVAARLTGVGGLSSAARALGQRFPHNAMQCSSAGNFCRGRSTALYKTCGGTLPYSNRDSRRQPRLNGGGQWSCLPGDELNFLNRARHVVAILAGGMQVAWVGDTRTLMSTPLHHRLNSRPPRRQVAWRQWRLSRERRMSRPLFYHAIFNGCRHRWRSGGIIGNRLLPPLLERHVLSVHEVGVAERARGGGDAAGLGGCREDALAFFAPHHDRWEPIDSDHYAIIIGSGATGGGVAAKACRGGCRVRCRQLRHMHGAAIEQDSADPACYAVYRRRGTLLQL